MTTLLKNGLILVLILLSYNLIDAQKSYDKVKHYDQFKSMDLSARGVPLNKFFVSFKTQMGLADGTDFKRIKTISGANGTNHHRYQQFHNGLRVFGCTYNLHSKDEIVHYANGSFLPKIEIPLSPKISSEKAYKKACAYLKTLQKDDALNFQKSFSNLVYIDRHFPSHSNAYALAYEIDIITEYPYNKEKVFVDARTGELLLKLPLIMHGTVKGEGICRYYGVQEIYFDSIAPNQYLLQDLSKGMGIYTSNGMTDEVFQNDSKYWDLINTDQNEVAIDVHYCSSAFYDFLINNYNWNGLDNEGFPLRAVVHANNGNNFVNAYWNGSEAYFGNGDCLRGPLTTAEVVAHEFMHGVTGFSSALIYSNESGAINESLSDMLGKALEYHLDPEGFDWFIGESFIINDKVEPFRNMADPNSLSDPQMYKGEFWRDGGGVHTNSGVGNKWFHFLVEGGSGITENGVLYDIKGIGMEKATRIAFHTATAYLVNSSDYNDFCRQSKKACQEIFGNNSQELQSLTEAWKAVGLPFGNIVGDLDLSVENTDPSFIISTCINGDYYPIQLKIRNNSTTDYLPEYQAQIIVEYRNEDYTYHLEEVIAAGDSTYIEISNLFFLDQTRDYSANVRLDFVDYNTDNNRDLVYVSNSISDQADFEIRGNPVDMECFDDRVGITVYVENIGCSLPANEEINITIEDPFGTIMWQRTINQNFEFPQNSTNIYTARFQAQSNNNIYYLKVETALDQELENNVLEYTARSNAAISNYYINGFSDITEINNSINLYSHIGFFNTPIFEYQSESYFACTGFSNTLQVPSCEGDPNFIFEESSLRQGLTAEMELCVDLSEIPEPMLSFDMIQFQNQNQDEFSIYEDIATMVKVSWEGNANGYEIIQTQPEGLKQNFEIELPEDLSGSLSIQFHALTGTNINNSNFLEYDVILLDNLEIKGKTVSTSEKEHEKIQIFPNPSSDLIQINHELQLKSIDIFNTSGKHVASYNNQNLNKLDISQISTGLYIVKLIDNQNQQYTQSIVILR